MYGIYLQNFINLVLRVWKKKGTYISKNVVLRKLNLKIYVELFHLGISVFKRHNFHKLHCSLLLPLLCCISIALFLILLSASGSPIQISLRFISIAHSILTMYVPSGISIFFNTTIPAEQPLLKHKTVPNTAIWTTSKLAKVVLRIRCEIKALKLSFGFWDSPCKHFSKGPASARVLEELHNDYGKPNDY